MPSRGEEPQEAQARQIRERKYFDRWDLAAVLALTIVAFVLRFFSPTLPDFFVHPFQWRLAACIFGVLCIPMMYLLARRLWPNRLFAIVAATLVCFDGMFFIQSRIGMIDIFPIFFILASYFLFLVHIQSRSFNASMLSLVALGIVLGIGIAAKWIVLAAWATIVFVMLLRIILRSLDFEFGPLGWPFLSWRRGEGPVISNVFWPTYLAVAIIALVIIPLGIYILVWHPFFFRVQ